MGKQERDLFLANRSYVTEQRQGRSLAFGRGSAELYDPHSAQNSEAYSTAVFGVQCVFIRATPPE